MGVQQSQVIFDNPSEWQRKKAEQKLNRKKLLTPHQRRKAEFHETNSCFYPHPIMKSAAEKHNQQKRNLPLDAEQEREFECKRAHNDYRSFKLCSKCQQLPQHIKQNKKLIYEQNLDDEDSDARSKVMAWERFSKDRRKQYREAEANTYGPQNPLFFNGFSLAVDRYNRQKPTFSEFSTEFTHPAVENNSQAPFFDNGEKMEQSVFESDFNEFSRRVDNDGFQQNLPI